MSAPARAYRREPDEKRERILDAARQAFAARGFTGATTAEIAARASVTESMAADKSGIFSRTDGVIWV